MQAIELPVVQPSTVLKRDGRTSQPFDVGKIENAVRKAWMEAEGTIDEEELHRVATFVAATLPETARTCAFRGNVSRFAVRVGGR